MQRRRIGPQLVRIGTLTGVDTVLVRRGIDPGDVLAELGMRPDFFEDGDRLIDAVELAALLEHCVGVTRAPNFVFEVVSSQSPTFLGTLGLLLETAKTVGEALEELTTYHHIHAQGSKWVLTEIEDEVVLEFDSRAMRGQTKRQRQLTIELAMGQLCHGVSLFGGTAIYPSRVTTHVGREDRAARYSRFFRAPIEWEVGADSLVYPHSAMGRRLPRSDVGFHEALRSQIADSNVAAEPKSIDRQVRVIIRSLLPTGQCNLERVARCLGCTQRTLQRTLRDEAETTYQTLLDDVRFEIVEHYLVDPRMTSRYLSGLAGFSDPSNFASAFRKRYGCSPGQWRARRMDAADA